jgi:uncharacterized membrane protein YphA (DoxX/SURF4 family)
MAKDDERGPALALAGLRLVTGALLARSAWVAIAAGAPTGEQLAGTIAAAASGSSGLLEWWARTVLLENPAALAALWSHGLLVVGLGLFLGALTRPMGLVGALFALHAWLYGSESFAVQHLLLLALCSAFAAARAGRTLGLDAALDGALPSWLTLVSERR